jgi:hypothetical protein
VAHQDERPLSHLGEMDMDAVRLDRPMCDPCHSCPPITEGAFRQGIVIAESQESGALCFSST